MAIDAHRLAQLEGDLAAARADVDHTVEQRDRILQAHHDVLADYARTQDALVDALQQIRELKRSRWCDPAIALLALVVGAACGFAFGAFLGGVVAPAVDRFLEGLGL